MDKLKEIYLQVIIQCIRDIASKDSKKYQDAIAWVVSKDFIEVCSMVNIQPNVYHLLPFLLCDVKHFLS